MPAAAVPIITAVAPAVLGAAGSIIGGNKQAKAAKEAAASQAQLSREQMAMAQAEKDRWYGQMQPDIAAYRAQAGQQVISPELTSQMYDFFRQNVDEQAGKDYTRMVQGLERRGLRDSGIAGKSIADFSKGQSDVKTQFGLGLAKDAAVTNYNAMNQARQYLLSLMMNGYGGGQASMNQANQIGANLQSDAIAAQLAGQNSKYAGYASAAGGVASAAGQGYQAYQDWKSRTQPTVKEYVGGQPVY